MRAGLDARAQNPLITGAGDSDIGGGDWVLGRFAHTGDTDNSSRRSICDRAYLYIKPWATAHLSAISA
mgnify:CR=1 FL=1